MPANERIVRVCRVIMMEGPENWVNTVLEHSYLKPMEKLEFSRGASIIETTRLQEVVDAS